MRKLIFHRSLKKIASLLVLVLSFFIAACGTTRHQVLKYQENKMAYNNFIPGLEPEERANSISVAVIGKGLAPETGSPQQRRLMAERAAVIDGYRQLSERLAGTIMQVYSSLGNNSLNQDMVISETNAYLKGARNYELGYENGVASSRVVVSISPRELKFYHGSELSRFIMGALAGASVGAAAGGLAGVITNSSDSIIYQTMGAAAAAGAANGAMLSIQ